MRKFFIFFIVGLFLISFVFASDKVAGMIYDNTGLIENDDAVQSYINKISEETGAVVVIILEDELVGNYDTWAKDTATKMRLRDIGEPKKNVLIGYFKKENLVYVTSKNGGKVKTSLKDEIVSLLKVAIDSKSDERFLNALRVLGEGLGVEGDEEKNVLTMKECKETLEQRKKDLEISDKFCYWEAMTELYDEKCENLNREQISEIFEKKAAYRELENKDWPSLNTDGDFCVEVVYDCDRWTRESDFAYSSFGFVKKMGDGHERFYVNPFKIFSREFVEVIFIHESLHLIQNETSRNSLELLGSKSFLDIYPECKDILNEESIARMPLLSLLENEQERIADEYINGKLKCYDGCGDDVDCFGKCDKEFGSKFEILNDDNEYIEEIIIVYQEYSLFSQTPKENIFYDFVTSSNSDFVKQINKVILIENSDDFKDCKYKEFSSDLRVISYMELDPRFSEIHRWWFDETGPKNCEVITTPEKSKEVFEKFLGDENIAEEYIVTQKQLRNVIELAKKLDKEQEVYDVLINRLPGIAYKESLDDITSAYA